MGMVHGPGVEVAELAIFDPGVTALDLVLALACRPTLLSEQVRHGPRRAACRARSVRGQVLQRAASSTRVPTRDPRAGSASTQSQQC